jgi:SAM-dependent methyltransferase
MRLNLGCGTDVRPGWVNVDLTVNSHDFEAGSLPLQVHGDMSNLSGPALRVMGGVAELILVNHALHYLTYDEAERAFDEWVRVLAPGGALVIVEPDVLQVIGALQCGDDDEAVAFVLGLTDDATEPTEDGKVLRWACWHGERRSLWSFRSLADRLERRGLAIVTADEVDLPWSEVMGERLLESFVVFATKSRA